ncbi:hypothetical protein CsatA_012970 [Cannabis sativa]
MGWQRGGWRGFSLLGGGCAISGLARETKGLFCSSKEHDTLVMALKQVDVVISTLPVPQHLDQLKILKAIKEAKEAGNIKGKQRFVPSEYGNEVDRVSGLAPFEALLENKRKIRRATEAAGISYTYVSANAFAAYFIEYLLHPHDQSAPNEHQVKVYGSGHTKECNYSSIPIARMRVSVSTTKDSF